MPRAGHSSHIFIPDEYVFFSFRCYQRVMPLGFAVHKHTKTGTRFFVNSRQSWLPVKYGPLFTANHVQI